VGRALANALHARTPNPRLLLITGRNVRDRDKPEPDDPVPVSKYWSIIGLLGARLEKNKPGSTGRNVINAGCIEQGRRNPCLEE